MNRIHPRFSIIIPVVGQPSALDETLASILRDLGEDCEVVLVHDGTFEDPYNIADELTVIDAQTKRLAAQVSIAVKQSAGQIIAIVRPGVELPEQWTNVVAAAFEDPTVASAAPILVAQSKSQSIVTAGVHTNYHYRRLLTGSRKKLAQRVFGRLQPLGPSAWAAFYRRSTLTMIGDLDQKTEDQYFDLDLALTLSQMGYACASLPTIVCQIDRSARVERESQRPHGVSAQRSIARHAAGESTFSRGLTSFVSELLSAILKPGAFQQAIGRFQASRFKAIDAAFATRMAEIVKRKKATEKAGLRVFEDEIRSDVSEAIARRAKVKRAA